MAPGHSQLTKNQQVYRVTLIAPDGREKVLTKPTMYTVEGRTVEIWLGEYDGAKLKLTVTPTLVEE